MYMLAFKRQYTADDIQDFPDDGNRYEVIDGELLVTPAPSLAHQAAVGKLFVLLDAYVKRHARGFTLLSPADIRFSSRRAVQPDVFVAPLFNDRPPRNWSEIKTLIVAAEVSSPTTARYDRVTKRKMFFDERVSEFWVVDLDARVIERSTPDNIRPEILDEKLEWMPAGATEPFVIDLVDYFASVLDT